VAAADEEPESRRLYAVPHDGRGPDRPPPHRCRTQAPCKHTPVLPYHFKGKTSSAIAGVTWWNFYVRLFPGAIRSPQIIQFLAQLLRHIPGKLLIVWDGLPGHRSRAVRRFVQQQRGRLWLEYLPGYAPELNPVEYLWSHWKQHELPNFCPTIFGQLSKHARQTLRRMRRRPTLVWNFVERGELFLPCLYYPAFQIWRQRP
jgi:transposase